MRPLLYRHKYLFVYGSLRKESERGYNFNRFGGQVFDCYFILNGYKMIDLGAYPAIVEGDENDKVSGEIHCVMGECYDKIKSMELGAGYIEKQFDIDGETVNMFVLDKDVAANYIKNGYKLVKNGNWD